MEKYQNKSDDDLISQYQSEVDVEIIGELFKRYKHIVLGICLRYLNNKSDAEDALMEVFEELMKSLQKANVRQFKPWVGTVTRNYLNRRFKVEARTNFTSLEEIFNKDKNDFMEFSEKQTPIIDKIEVDKREAALLSALGELKSDQSKCIKLFFLEDKTYTEVCEQTGYSFKKVKSFIQNGKRNLKNKLDGG